MHKKKIFKFPYLLLELPIKLGPEEVESPREDTQHKKSSSHNTKNSHSKSDHLSRNGHSSKDGEKRKRSDSTEKKSSQSSESKSSERKHHKSHHHSRSSHGENSSLKRQHEPQPEPKENKSSHKKPKLDPEDTKKDSSSSSSGSHSKSSSKQKESSSTKSREKTSKEVMKEADKELDGSQGMGFAEALALFDMPSSSKKKDLHLADKIVKVKSPSKPPRDDKRPSSGSDSKKSLKLLTVPPKLLFEKHQLEPLLDIVGELPTDVAIPDYRPMPLNSVVKDYINTSVLGSASSYFRPQPKMTDRELLTESFSSKANRTRVYSGNRVQRAVPTLFESCIKVLQDNIEFIESTGGVPFHVIRPVLEKAKPEQLSSIEYYNQDLLEDTDVLWEPHVKRKFRTRQRLEMESWREMYERCTEEDEIKLSKLTRNIKQHQETTSNGVQKTKMAFVDSMVKPPRGIMRKQEIYGTNRKLVVSPAARTVGLRNMAPNLAAAGDARLRVATGIRDDAQNGKNMT